jgi:hypothetical protein
MSEYRVIFQDQGNDTRRADATYIRVQVWEGERYRGAWFGVMNGRSKRRYLVDPELTAHYDAMAPLALALAIREAVEQDAFDAPRDVPLHPSTVLQLTPEAHTWAQGDEVMTFEI